MYPIISYTIHLTICMTLGLIFWFYKGEGNRLGSTYRTFLRIMAITSLISGAMSAVLLYLHVEDIDESFMYGFISTFFNIIITGLYFRPFLLNLRDKTKLVQWQDGLMHAYVSLGLMHPLLFYQYQVSHHFEYSPNLSSYNEFLQTPECELLTFIVYIIGAAYLILGAYNTIRCLRIILLWDRQHKGQKIYGLAIELFFFLLFAFLMMIVDAVVFEYYNFPYYADLPVWAVFALVVAVKILNCKPEYVRLEHEAVRLQIEFVGAKMFYQKSALKLNEDENIHRQEQAVVLRAISDWAARDDRPYLNEGLTISTMSKEIGIPETVIIRHLNSSYGLYFDEFISYLRSKTDQNTLILSMQ